AADRLYPTARRGDPGRPLSRDQRQRRGDRHLRRRARRAGEADRVEHWVPQLVPRRPRHPRGVAMDLRPLPRRNGCPKTRGVRAGQLTSTSICEDPKLETKSKYQIRMIQKSTLVWNTAGCMVS